MRTKKTANGVEWLISSALVPYPEAVAFMEQRVAAIREGKGAQAVWLLEHPPLYTAGTSARPEELLTRDRFPVHASGRGGRHTYHGPGQRVAYVMLDLRTRGSDVRWFVHALEAWVIATLRRLGIEAWSREGRVGIWVLGSDGREDKIAAIGVRVRRWVSYHGISLNVAPNLGHYDGIVPCGLADHGVTSLERQGVMASMDQVDLALMETFDEVFSEPA